MADLPKPGDTLTWAGIPLYRDGTGKMLGFTSTGRHVHVVWPISGAKVALPLWGIVAVNGEPASYGDNLDPAPPPGMSTPAPPPPPRRRRRRK